MGRQHQSKDMAWLQLRSEALGPQCPGLCPQGTSAKPLRRRQVEALGVHTLPAMPAPGECQWDLCGGVFPVLLGFLPTPGCARLQSGHGKNPSLASQSLLPSGGSCSLLVSGGGVLIQPLRKPSKKVLLKCCSRKERSPAVQLNSTDEG